VLNAARRWVGVAIGQSGTRARLIRGAVGSGAVQMAALGTSLLLAVVLARGLGAEGYGIYAYAIALLNLLLVVAEAGVPTRLMREVAVARAGARWASVRGDLRTGLALIAGVALVVAVAGACVVVVVDPALATAEARTCLLMLAVLPVVGVAKGLAYALRGLDRVVLAQACEILLRPAMALGLLAAAFWFLPQLRLPEGAMAAQLLSAAAVAGLAAVWLRRCLPGGVPAPEPRALGRWLRGALPFALIGGAGVLNTQTDIIMLGWFRSDAEVGAYRIAQQGGLLTLLVLQAAQSVLGPAFGRSYAAGDTTALRGQFRWAARWVAAGTVPVAGVLIVFAQPIVEAVFGPAFALAAGPMAILAAGYLGNVAFGPVGLLLQMAGRERKTAWVLWATVGLNAGLNALLIPLYGVYGGALATAVAVVLYHAGLRAIAVRDLGV
jgi:O-antigen/teichoic acid export membrane protein